MSRVSVLLFVCFFILLLIGVICLLKSSGSLWRYCRFLLSIPSRL